MLIQPSSAYSALLPTSGAHRAAAAQAADVGVAAANVAERSSISAAGRARLAADSGYAGSGATVAYDTDRGTLQLDIDAYFTPPAQSGATFELPPLLSPSPRNIAALREHVSAVMPQFLAQHGIAAPPASIEYDNYGKMILPADYADAEAFRQALAATPALDRELRTSAALSSDLLELNKSLAFQQEYAAASSPAAVQAVLAKYAWLLAGQQSASKIELQFAASGQMSIVADGQPVA